MLDEFQRFRNLIDRDSKEEEAQIPRRIFQKRKARILLLSATPFKAFTGDIDLATVEYHYRDFLVVLDFLTEGKKEILNEYEQHRGALHDQLMRLQAHNIDLCPDHRRGIERILRSVMCRTERQAVATDPGAMIADKWRDGDVPFGIPDIRNYRSTDKVIIALNSTFQARRHVIGKSVEYCKLALHPHSFAKTTSC